MLDRERLMSHIRDQGDRVMLVRVLDKVEAALRGRFPGPTDFLDPHQGRVVAGILAGIAGISFDFFGGYPAAERKRLVVRPVNTSPDVGDAEIWCLEIRGNFRLQQVSHRDFLGALLGLGIRREKVGDLIVLEDACQVILAAEVAPYVRAGLDEVHRVRVEVRDIVQGDLRPPQEEVLELETSVASLRLDAVAAHGFRLARAKMVQEIRAGKVKVNWRETTDPDQRLAVGDVISCRGYGRLAVVGVEGPTRKGRWIVILKRKDSRILLPPVEKCG